MSLSVDEAEHSLEMHLPYIRYLLQAWGFRTRGEGKKMENGGLEREWPGLIPILVGNTSEKVEREYGALLAPYFQDEGSVVVVSSDFCHWGLRFGYTYYLPFYSSMKSTAAAATKEQIDTSKGHTLKKSSTVSIKNPEIHESIDVIDKAAMSAVESGSHREFLEELKRSGNTVCGRHPIGVVMASMEVLRNREGGDIRGREARFTFVRYERSSEVSDVRESSVSYASAFAVL